MSTLAGRGGHRAPPGLAPVLEEVSQRADWRRISRLYLQLSQIKAEPRNRSEPPADLTGGLAEALARTFASYEEAEGTFLTDLVALFGAIDEIEGDDRDRFRYLYKDEGLDAFGVYRPAGGARRRPKPFEAAVETARRISDLNRIRDALSQLPSSAVLGGSLSYGRFFNTLGGAGGGRPSDIDLLVIVPDYELRGEIVTALGKVPFIEAASLEAMAARSESFTKVRDDVEGPCLFQHKLRLWDGDIKQSNPFARYQIELNYRLTIHVASCEDFKYLTLRDIPSLSDAGALQRPIYEFRDDAPPTGKEEHWCFAGYRRERDLKSEPAHGGYLTRLLGCEIHDRRFYPGVHLNLILPQFEVRWESPQTRIRLALQALRWKLLTRLGDERRLRHLEVQRLSLSHSRSPFFAPHVTARVDRD